jgi:hypothetical protein
MSSVAEFRPPIRTGADWVLLSPRPHGAPPLILAGVPLDTIRGQIARLRP